MPTKAERPEFPQPELADRQEGYGELGFIYNYPLYRDNGEWPAAVERGEQPTEASEVSDPQESDSSRSNWFRIRNQGKEAVNDFQGETYVI